MIFGLGCREFGSFRKFCICFGVVRCCRVTHDGVCTKCILRIGVWWWDFNLKAKKMTLAWVCSCDITSDNNNNYLIFLVTRWTKTPFFERTTSIFEETIRIDKEKIQLASGILCNALSKLRFRWCCVMLIRVLVTWETGGKRIPIDLKRKHLNH